MRSNAQREPVTSYTFQDEFDGPAGSPPDPAKWTFDLGSGGWGNNELQTYTDSVANVFQDGKSHLVIRATKETSSSVGGALPAVTYRSGRIKTLGKFSQLGGYFEARIKVDSERGLWPAFWLMGQDIPAVGWPACGEVDVMEDYGYSTVQTSVHAPAGGDAVHSVHHDLASDTDWHVYQMHWSSERMSFSRDGHRYMTVNEDFCPPRAWVFGPRAPNNGGMFLLLNLAVGGSVGDPPESTVFPVNLMVDYVRVWAPDVFSS
jgi:beta-glucanase (GH16 family)